MAEKMPISERAKQFMPFAALRGFGGYISNRAKVKSEKRILTEEENDRLNQIFSTLKKGEVIFVTYFRDGYNYSVTGAVSMCDTALKRIRVIKDEIAFDEIISVKKCEEDD